MKAGEEYAWDVREEDADAVRVPVDEAVHGHAQRRAELRHLSWNCKAMRENENPGHVCNKL